MVEQAGRARRFARAALVCSRFSNGARGAARPTCVSVFVAVLLLLPSTACLAATNAVVLTGYSAPDVGGSFVRMLAGLAFVLALFFGGVWVFKNWQRVSRVRSNSKLNIMEARSLGPRQAIYVVGYNEQRFLVAASPAGISLVSALPEAATGTQSEVIVSNGASPFAQVLQSVLGRK